MLISLLFSPAAAAMGFKAGIKLTYSKVNLCTVNLCKVNFTDSFLTLIPVLFCFPRLSQDYVVNVTEEFLEFISDGAIECGAWVLREWQLHLEVDSLHAKTNAA